MSEPLDLNILRVEHNRKKFCTCEKPHYIIDTKNRAVQCEDCKAYVDPYEALLTLTKNYKRYQDSVNHYKHMAALYARKHHMNKEFKDIGSQYKKGMIAHCPSCNGYLFPNEISYFTNVAIIDTLNWKVKWEKDMEDRFS